MDNTNQNQQKNPAQQGYSSQGNANPSQNPGQQQSNASGRSEQASGTSSNFGNKDNQKDNKVAGRNESGRPQDENKPAGK